jgi:hypothetical protein
VPIGLAIAGANRHDMQLVRPTLASLVVERPEPTDDPPQGMCLDKGYDYKEVHAILQEFGFTAHIRARGEEARELRQEAGKKARRWVVEISQIKHPYPHTRLLSYYCPNRMVAARYRRGQVLASSRRRERERMSPRVLPPRP